MNLKINGREVTPQEQEPPTKSADDAWFSPLSLCVAGSVMVGCEPYPVSLWLASGMLVVTGYLAFRTMKTLTVYIETAKGFLMGTFAVLAPIAVERLVVMLK